RIPDPSVQRATISQMVIVNVGLRVVAFGVAGLLSSRTLLLTVMLLLPVAWAGVLVGDRVHWSVTPATMARMICAALLLTCDALIVRTHLIEDYLARRPLHRELDGLFVAQDRGAQLVAGLDGLEHLEDLDHVGVGGDRHALDGQQDVAADDDLLPLDDPDAITAAHSHASGDRILHDMLDKEAALLRHLERLGHGAGDQHEIDPIPSPLAVDQEVLHRIRRHDEAESFAAARLRDVVADDPDHLAGSSEHG